VPGVLRLLVERPDGTLLVAGSLDAGQPHGGGVRLASLRLPAGLAGQDVRLRAEVETRGVRRPARWACAQPLDDALGLILRVKRPDEPDWRKGI
jgi:hypothetical protein